MEHVYIFDIIESQTGLDLKGLLKIIKSNLPAMSRDTLH